MEKKIIAIALVLVVMVTAFVGCGQKYKTTKVGNKEYLLHTDAEGNTIIKDDQLVAVVTDRDGEIITYENGENQTFYVEIPKEFVIGSGYAFDVKGDWTYIPNINGFINNDYGTDVYVNVVEEKNTYLSLDKYFEETEKKNQEFLTALKKQYPDTEIKITDGTVTELSLKCKIVETKVNDDKGVLYYGYVVYFLYQDKLVSINYTSQDYTYETVDILKLINDSIVFDEKYTVEEPSTEETTTEETTK